MSDSQVNPMDCSDWADRFVRSCVETFAGQKSLAERAIAQLRDEQLHIALDANTNSVVVIMKHMVGNMKSRWTDFLTTDGDKPWRDRDDEFVDDIVSRDDLMNRWQDGWSLVLSVVGGLTATDLNNTVIIRGQTLSVVRAILRQTDHYGYHVGQIVQLARFLAKDDWTVLTIPRGGSRDYNDRVWR
jgi:Protein of unknown function (DUF1572)